ncbi:MAG: hypothetical protein WC530_10475 [Candidatus Omnitrophota bacterium]
MKVEGALGVKPPAPDFVLVLPVIMPSLNKQLRMHWKARGRLKKNISWHLYSVMGREEIAHRDRLAHVTIRVFSNAPKVSGGRARRLDTDNLIGGQKPLVDAMKNLGLLKDDNPKWAAITYLENRDKVETPRTEIDVSYGGKA